MGTLSKFFSEDIPSAAASIKNFFKGAYEPLKEFGMRDKKKGSYTTSHPEPNTLAGSLGVEQVGASVNARYINGAKNNLPYHLDESILKDIGAPRPDSPTLGSELLDQTASASTAIDIGVPRPDSPTLGSDLFDQTTSASTAINVDSMKREKTKQNAYANNSDSIIPQERQNVVGQSVDSLAKSLPARGEASYSLEMQIITAYANTSRQNSFLLGREVPKPAHVEKNFENLNTGRRVVPDYEAALPEDVKKQESKQASHDLKDQPARQTNRGTDGKTRFQESNRRSLVPASSEDVSAWLKECKVAGHSLTPATTGERKPKAKHRHS